MTDIWLKPADAATYLGLTEGGLSSLRQRGKGPYYHKLGTARCARIRYAREDLDAWVKSNAGTAKN